MTQFFTISDCARLLGIQQYRIEYVHRTGRISSPTIVCGRRLYTWADIEQLAEHFGVTLGKEKDNVR